MKVYPTLETERLFLRPFLISDAQEVRRLGGDPEVVDTLFTLNLCTAGVAHQWIVHQYEHFEKGEWINFAITDRQSGHLLGSVGLDINRSDHHAEIMYWVGKMYWGRGYATEAARVTLAYGFNELRLHRVYARYLSRNPASGRVLEKLGMVWEGRLRQHLKKRGVHDDLDIMGILRSEFNVMQ